MEFAQGRMKKKILGASEALQAGVRQVILADGRVAEPVSQAGQAVFDDGYHLADLYPVQVYGDVRL